MESAEVESIDAEILDEVRSLAILVWVALVSRQAHSLVTQSDHVVGIEGFDEFGS